ncbi:hypothetical protein M3583_23685, partial [Bacillus subtilis]|nr:hypothetical protein [Bacillus subtilis]
MRRVLRVRSSGAARAADDSVSSRVLRAGIQVERQRDPPRGDERGERDRVSLGGNRSVVDVQ